MGNRGSRAQRRALRRKAWTKKDDPFSYARKYCIPETTPSNAIFSYARYSNCWGLYKWGGMKFNQSFDFLELKELLRNIQRTCKPHPKPSYMKKPLFFLFVFYGPIFATFIVTLCLSLAIFQKYVWAIVVVSVALLLKFIYFRGVERDVQKYTEQLEERERSIRSLLTEMNNSFYIEKGFKFKVGDYGAWIELEFLREDLYLVAPREGNSQVGSGAEAAEVAVTPVPRTVIVEDQFNNLAKPLTEDLEGGSHPF